MYGSNVQTLKTAAVAGKLPGTLKLVQSVQHRHARLASGRGTIKTTVTYSVYLLVLDEGQDPCIDIHFGANKSAAVRAFKAALSQYNCNQEVK